MSAMHGKTAGAVSADLDLADIQGNILTAYGRLGFPKGRFLLLNIRDARAGRAFVEFMRRRVTLNAQMLRDGQPVAALDKLTDEIIAFCEVSDGGLALCRGHRGADSRWQDLGAVTVEAPDGSVIPTPREHFGFTDAISDPAF